MIKDMNSDTCTVRTLHYVAVVGDKSGSMASGGGGLNMSDDDRNLQAVVMYSAAEYQQ